MPNVQLPLDRFSEGTVFSAWVGTPAAGIVEALIGAGFDAAVLDMQHGGFDEAAAAAGIAAAALFGKPAVVRVPVEGFPSASRLLDAGAAGVIAPMIHGAADAKRFAAFCKYPPVGSRSWGPGRATTLSGLAGRDYFRRANGLNLALAMIETRSALDALDDILAVDGIDGVFAGPSDLSVALTGELDPSSPAVDEALAHVAGRARAAGKVAGMFCFTGTQARAMAARGFGFLTIATDTLLIAAAARSEIAAARG